MTEYPAGRAIVVVLEPGLHQSRVNGLMLNIRDLPGVTSVTDLNKIDQTTLDYLLHIPTERVKQADKNHYNNLREYWRRRRQPYLPMQKEEIQQTKETVNDDKQ